MKSILPHLPPLLLLTFTSLISSTIGDIANLTFYGVWIGAGPQAIITKVSPLHLIFLTQVRTNNITVREHTSSSWQLSRSVPSPWCPSFLARHGACEVKRCVPERDYESRWWAGRVVLIAFLLLQVRILCPFRSSPLQIDHFMLIWSHQ
jgi:hypothetical protein